MHSISDYLNAIKFQHKGLNSNSGQINISSLYALANLIHKAKTDYPVYFANWYMQPCIQNGKLVGWYCCPKSSPYFNK